VRWLAGTAAQLSSPPLCLTRVGRGCACVCVCDRLLRGRASFVLMKLPYNFNADGFLEAIGSAHWEVLERFVQRHTMLILLRAKR